MNENYLKVIGARDKSREDANVLSLNNVDGLKDIFYRDFNTWSNFDGWESIGLQQWIFERALDIYKGKKIDIKCDCCEYVNFPSNFDDIKKEKCFGIKSSYMIKKVAEEITLAKKRRESDGTYSA